VADTKLSSIVDRIVYLPSSPEIATRISLVADDPRSSAADIAEIVKKDPSTAARILRLVNSSYFGLRSQVSTLSHAVSLLGLNVIRSVALSVAVVGSFKKMRVPRIFDHRRFWEHSALTACLARMIAQEHGGVEPEAAFDVGLMHDLGKLILACYAPEEFQQIIERADQQQQSFVDAENEVMDTNHCEIGGWLAERWQFPKYLVNGISHHGDRATDDSHALVAVCQFANALSKAKGFRTVGSHDKATAPRAVLDCLNISDGSVTKFFGEADAEIERSKQLLVAINE